MEASDCKNGGWCATMLSTGLTFCHCPPEFFGTLCEGSLAPETAVVLADDPGAEQCRIQAGLVRPCCSFVHRHRD